MKPIDFVKKYKFADIMAESRTGLSWKANLAQAALETGWGEHAPGNNMFGVKDSDGINGNEQLLTTCELRYKYDFEYFAISCITIRHKLTGKDVPLKLNRGQRRLLKRLEKYIEIRD